MDDFPPESYTLSEGERFNLTNEEVYNDERLDTLLDVFIADPLSQLDSDTTHFLALEDHHIPSFVYIAKTENDAKSTNLQELLVKLAKDNYRKELVFHYTWEGSAYYEILNLVFNISENKLPALIFLKPNNTIIDDVEKFIAYKDTITTLKNQTTETQNISISKETNNSFSEEDLILAINAFRNEKTGLIKVLFSESLEAKLRKQSLYGLNEGEYIIGTEWKEKVIENLSENIFVLFCVEKAENCKEMINIIRKLVMFLKSQLEPNQKDVIKFIITDPLINELTHLKYRKFPSIFLLKRSQDLNIRISSVVQFTKEVSVYNLLNFLDSELNKEGFDVESVYFKKIRDQIDRKQLENFKMIKYPKKDYKDMFDLTIESIDLDNLNIGLRRTIDIELDDIDSYLDKINNDTPSHDDL